MDQTTREFYVVIPARFAATRLPGKPLREIAGRPMIAHVWDRGVASGAREVFVATDDERVRDKVHAFGGQALMTSSEHASGTDRIAEVAKRLDWSDDMTVVNLQGDEPGMNSQLLRTVADALRLHKSAGIATLATPITAARDLFDENAVKVVLDDRQNARYFSRAPIPWVRGVFAGDATAAMTLPNDVPFLRHLGVYAYRVGVLRRLCGAAPSECERAESLEQLRALSLGIEIHVSIVHDPPPGGIDTEEDLARAQKELA